MNVNAEYRIYVVRQIDWWAGWLEAVDLARAAQTEFAEVVGVPIEPGDSVDGWEQNITALFWRLKPALVQAGWEGEFAARFEGGPRFTVLPNPDDCDSALMMAIKEPNNGTCYIASPFPLVWLGEPEVVVPAPSDSA